MKVNDLRLAELNQLRLRNAGVLMPAQVVAFARNPDTALHSAFDWVDSEAAEKWRVHQARNLIRILVTIEDVGGEEMVIRPFVSLPSDRRAGGYRMTVDVMQDDGLRSELLAAALNELRSVQAKYRQLKALEKVFAAVDAVDEQVRATSVPSRIGRAGEARQIGA